MQDTVIESADVVIEDDDDGMEEVVNISGNVVKFKMDNNVVTMKPGGRARIPRAYAIGQKSSPNRDARIAAVEMLTNSAVVASSDKRAKNSPFAQKTAPASLPEAKVVS